MLSNIVTDCVSYLISNKSFYAAMALCTKFQVSKRVPTAGVYIKDGVNIIINPDFFATLTPQEQAGVLEHEFRHIIEKHMLRAKELIPEMSDKSQDIVKALKSSRKFRRLNVAQDLAINQNISSIKFNTALPEMACLPERFMIPSGKVSEHYYERINNNMFSCAKCKMPMSKEAAVERNERAKTENNASLKCSLTKLCECPKDGEGDELGELLDAHEVWGEGTENAKEIEDEIKKYIEKAVAANEKLRGNIPQDIKESLDNILRSPYNWKSHLSRFIARSSEVIRIETRSKRNRRYGFKYPGYRNEEVLNLGLAIDTSGSVDMNMLTMIFAHLNQIRKTTPFVITIIECDCDVGAVYDMPKVLKNVNVTGRGGTAFTPAIKKAEELKLDALVYFTDGYGEHDLVKPKMPIIWAITPGGSEDCVKGKGQILKLPEPKA